MTILKLLIPLAVFAFTLFHGHQPSLPKASDTTREELTDRESVNPLEIKRLIDESKVKWKRTGMVQNVGLVDTWKKLGIYDRQLEDCGAGACDAEVSKAELDGRFPKELILKVNNNYLCRFLMFTESVTNKGGWLFRGHVDWDFNRYQIARHRIVQANGRSWMVIRGQA